MRVEMPGEPSRAALAAHCGSSRVLIMRREPGFTRALVETLEAPPAGATVIGRYAIPERGARTP